MRTHSSACASEMAPHLEREVTALGDRRLRPRTFAGRESLDRHVDIGHADIGHADIGHRVVNDLVSNIGIPTTPASNRRGHAPKANGPTPSGVGPLS
ncbi:hypothetical protein ACFXPS_20955 [Nocardia sp. NPDC059091]|uniref:hypothetical protein n=1 Tax=unclassified Nocardia TaxID=2637762 RepID=UPI0036C5BE2E